MIFAGMRMVWDERGIGMKVAKVVLDEKGIGMKVVLDEIVTFGMKVVRDENCTVPRRLLAQTTFQRRPTAATNLAKQLQASPFNLFRSAPLWARQLQANTTSGQFPTTKSPKEKKQKKNNQKKRNEGQSTWSVFW